MPMTIIDLEKLKTGAGFFGLSLSEKQLEEFDILAAALSEGNKRANLVGSAGADVLLSHHFLDSLSCLQAGVLEEGMRGLDLGSGAGLPGLPLAIARPDLRLVLLDSSTRKTGFLERAVKGLGLSNVEVVCARAEEAGRDKAYREAFDAVLARAVASLPVLSEYALPFLTKGGRLIAQRGPRAAEDAAESAAVLAELNGRVIDILDVKVPYLEAERRLVIIEKTGSTPDRYPRRSGIPLKRPILGSK